MLLKAFIFSFSLICSINLWAVETNYAKKNAIEVNFSGIAAYDQFGVDTKFFVFRFSAGLNWFFIPSFYVGLDNGFSKSIGLTESTGSTFYYAPKVLLGKVWNLNALYLDLGLAYGIALSDSKSLDGKLAKTRDIIEAFGYAKFILDQHSLVFLGPNIIYQNLNLSNIQDPLSIQVVIGYSLFF